MSFIKAATSTLVSAGQKGFKIGRRSARMAKLNLTLKMERDKQRVYYQEIGQHVHINQTGDVTNSEKVRVLREKINIGERKINRIVEELNLLKRINSCSYCGHIIEVDTKYCPKCSYPRS